MPQLGAQIVCIRSNPHVLGDLFPFETLSGCKIGTEMPKGEGDSRSSIPHVCPATLLHENLATL